MLQNVVALALPGVAPFELGVVCEVFGIDRSDVGLPAFDFAVVSEGGAPVQSSVGFTISGTRRPAGGIAPPTWCACPRHFPICRRAQLSSSCCEIQSTRGAKVLSVCSGAFTLGDAGLLDDRPCTTHWFHVDELAGAIPAGPDHL